MVRIQFEDLLTVREDNQVNFVNKLMVRTCNNSTYLPKTFSHSCELTSKSFKVKPGQIWSASFPILKRNLQRTDCTIFRHTKPRNKANLTQTQQQNKLNRTV